MRKLLLLTILPVLAIWSNARATTVAIVVENNTSRSTIGVDTLLGDRLAYNLGYTIHYRDIDSVHTPGYWDTLYDAIILAGAEQTVPSPTANADSICKSAVPVVAIGPHYFNEINLGTDTSRATENAGYVINIGQTHWITKVLQDTVIFWAASSTESPGIYIPDTSHSVQVLLLDKDFLTDTSRATLAVAEQGATIINTGDGQNVAMGRRVFFGTFQAQSVSLDSCQFYTTFERCVAWSLGDTLNAGLMARLCFSGKYEIDQSAVVENSSGTDSLQCHGVWDDLYTGQDYDSKHFFIKPRGIAVQRKIANVYRSATVALARWRLVLKSVPWDVTPPATWTSTWAFAQIKKYWNGGDRGGAVFSATVPYACWTYRYGADVAGTFTAYPWTEGGAQADGDDAYEDYIDSIVVTQDSVIARAHYIDCDTVGLNSVILDSTLFQGWVANTISETNPGPGVETAYYSVTNPSRPNRPVLSMILSSYSTTDPMPSIAILYDSLTMASTVGTNPSTDLYNHNNFISNGSGGALSCVSVSDDAAWLTLTYTGDPSATPFGITAHIDVTGLAAGYYSALVTVQCDDADNSPATYKVALTLTAAAPPASVPKMSGFIR